MNHHPIYIQRFHQNLAAENSIIYIVVHEATTKIIYQSYTISFRTIFDHIYTPTSSTGFIFKGNQHLNLSLKLRADPSINREDILESD